MIAASPHNMRVLFLNPSGHLGGAEIILLDVMASLRATVPDWDLHLISAGLGALTRCAEQLGVTTQVVEFPESVARLGDAGAGGPAGHRVSKTGLLARISAAAPALAGYAWRLRRAIRSVAPDVIHTNGFKMHVLGAAAKPPGTPVIWHIHDYVTARPLMGALLKRSSRRCSSAVANSQSTAQDLASLCGRSIKVHTVPNGVNLERFSPEGEVADLDAMAGMPPAPPGTVRIGLVATLARWKGHEVFLQALSRLPAGVPFRGYVVGGAVYRTEGSQYGLDDLRGLAARFGIADRVAFTGYTPEPPAAMRALDIVVHASTQPEPFGLVIVEGMACGKAVIASRAGGAGEILSMGPGPVGYKPGSVTELAEAMERLARDRDLRARMGREARATAERFFDRRRLAPELIPVYRQAVGRRVSEGSQVSARCRA